jgi:hypothetical protein
LSGERGRVLWVGESVAVVQCFQGCGEFVVYFVWHIFDYAAAVYGFEFDDVEWWFWGEWVGV